MKLQEFMNKSLSVKIISDYEYQEIRPQIVCKDGVRLSVQASDGHYSSPRINGFSNYESVEVGYPSVRPSFEWSQYFDGTWQEVGFYGFIKNLTNSFPMVIWAYKNVSLSRAWHYFTRLFADNATESVYGYVPVELVESFIESHGGIDEDKTFAPKVR